MQPLNWRGLHRSVDANRAEESVQVYTATNLNKQLLLGYLVSMFHVTNLNYHKYSNTLLQFQYFLHYNLYCTGSDLCSQRSTSGAVQSSVRSARTVCDIDIKETLA